MATAAIFTKELGVVATAVEFQVAFDLGAMGFDGVDPETLVATDAAPGLPTYFDIDVANLPRIPCLGNTGRKPRLKTLCHIPQRPYRQRRPLFERHGASRTGGHLVCQA